MLIANSKFMKNLLRLNDDSDTVAYFLDPLYLCALH